MNEDAYGCGAIVMFVAVWVGCTIAAGPLGFMLGWMPALILAVFWPFVLLLGRVAVEIVVVLVALVILLIVFLS